MCGQTLGGFFFPFISLALSHSFMSSGSSRPFAVAEDIKAKRVAEMDVNLNSSLICAEK